MPFSLPCFFHSLGFHGCSCYFLFPLFSFPSLYPFAEEYGGDFPYQDFSTFHSRLGTSVVLCMCVKVCACDCKFRDYLRVTFFPFDTYCIFLEHLSVHMDVQICPCIFEYAPVCSSLQPAVQITYFCLTTASSRGGAHMQKATWKGLLVAVSFYYALRCHVC